MTARATDADVKAYIDTVRNTEPFIKTANVIVNDVLSSSGLTEDRLTQIEILLAAHFCCLVEEKGGMQRSQAGQSTDTYQRRDVKGDLGLRSTRYGENALAMDPTGALAELSAAGGTLKAQFAVLGSDTPAIPIVDIEF